MLWGTQCRYRYDKIPAAPPAATPADLIRIILYRNGGCVFFFLSILLSALPYLIRIKKRKEKKKGGREGFPENGLKNGMKTAFFYSLWKLLVFGVYRVFIIIVMVQKKIWEEHRFRVWSESFMSPTSIVLMFSLSTNWSQIGFSSAYVIL